MATKYSLKSSPLFHCQSKRRLKELLKINDSEIWRAIEYNKLDSYYKKIPQTKEDGSVRITYSPSPKLKRIQKNVFKLLRNLPRPEYLFGGEPGKSNITNAKEHLMANEAFKVDISGFFDQVEKFKVFRFFRDKMQIAENLARILANITTKSGTLVQGSPASVVLSFYANEYMFRGLSKIAKDFNLKMTVFVDDIVFSTESKIVNFHVLRNKVIGLMLSQGYRLNARKVKRYRNSKQIYVTGILVGSQRRLKVPNGQYKAIHELRKSIRDGMSKKEIEKIQERISGKIHYINQVQIAT